MKKILLVLSGISILFFLSCSAHRSPAAVTEIEGGVSSILSYEPETGVNKFCMDLYGGQKDAAGNVLFSPFSIYTCMGMAYEGAKGATASEIQNVFHYQIDEAVRHESFDGMISTINAPGKQYQLSTSNNIWVEQTMPLLTLYSDVLTTYYHADSQNMDFLNSPEASRLYINTAVENQTAGIIKNLIPDGSVGSDTKLVLTNAIYFKADWLNQFDPNDTGMEDFYTQSGVTVTVDMMHKDLYRNIEDYYGAASVLELPYVDNEVSMFIFLPSNGQMAVLESRMTGDNVANWLSSRIKYTVGDTLVRLTLPKFSYSFDISLTEELKQMGMPTAFSPLADLSGINGSGGLMISDVVHKAFIEVGEIGTEAAAATGTIIRGTSWVITEPFSIDHPFIFAIVENSTNTILFMGKVNDPTL
ncbi:MAG: hypothetical protein CVV21_06425 [Candidatus Goldiibacteriota bacterium HGW-Goldbacteria-1]|jgi:serpin B|nr:MAG: hypothetical protein CVV21_06425 [Candidatus Goldiibacteriota bacterium HGW-Goldbacteria-1]